jgi:hypothetical protein
LYSEEELMPKFSTVRSHKKPKKSVTDDVKQSSDRDRDINKSWNHNQAKERIVNNYPQCSCICVSAGCTVILRSIAMRGFLVIISEQV